jgi:hypothetical protein
VGLPSASTASFSPVTQLGITACNSWAKKPSSGLPSTQLKLTGFKASIVAMAFLIGNTSFFNR